MYVAGPDKHKIAMTKLQLMSDIIMSLAESLESPKSSWKAGVQSRG